MSGRIVDFQKSPHQATQELLPWFANGTLDADEHRSLATHLESCAECRQELEALRRLQTAYVASDVTADAEGALVRLWAQVSPHVSPQSIDAVPAAVAATGAALPQSAAPASTSAPGRRSRPSQGVAEQARELALAGSSRNLNLPWRRGAWRASLFGTALAAQFGVIVALGWTVWTLQNPPARFHALGAAQAPLRVAGDAIVVFVPNIQERQMRRILEDAGARIVDGPTNANGYVIRFEHADIDATIARMGSDPAVHFVARLAPEGD